MTDDQIKLAEAVVRWIELKRQWEKPFGPDELPTDADIAHSALLARLLRGKEPLPEPPPEAFSYPWYEVVEDTARAHRGIEFGFRKDGGLKECLPDEADYVCLNQNPFYRIIEHRSDHWVVAYRRWRFIVWRDRTRVGGPGDCCWIVRDPSLE